MTGCDNNSELKLWSCERWSCLQTIKFAPTPSTGKMPVLKAGLDLSAEYLLLSDIYNKVLYILSLSKDAGEAYISTVSEFLLPYPILSFGIIDAGQGKIRPNGESLEDLCQSEEDIDEQLVIRMYLVQPKSLQECHIAFKPAVRTSSDCLLDALTHDSLEDYPEDLPDIATVNHNGISVENCEEDRSLTTTIDTTINHNSSSLNLMTPDAFSSPAKKEDNELESNPGSPQLGNVLSASPSLAQAVQALNVSDPPLTTSEMEEQAPASGGSSPSREVQEILSLTKSNEEVKTENKQETKTNADENWSNIPMVLLKDVSVHAMQDSEKFSESDENNVQKKKGKDESLSLATDNPGISWQANNNVNYLELNDKLKSLLEITQNQYQELTELRAELTRLRQETPVSTRIESLLTRISQQQNAALEQALYNQMTRQHEFLNTVEKTIKDKLENVLVHTIQETVEPFKHQIGLDINRMDELLKDNIMKLINSTHVKDALALAATNAAKPALSIAFKEAFTTILLPGMEKTCQVMFRQVQDAFVRGTRECK